MKKFKVWFEQTNTLDIEVEAKNKDEARHKAENILESKTFEQNVEKAQKGYFEYCYTDTNEGN